MKERFSSLIRNPTFQAVALAIVYILVASFISLLKHYSYDTYAFDLGIFAQSLKSTLQGDILYNPSEGMCHLGYHFQPILFLLVPIFWLAPYCETLLVVQSIALGAGGYLVYKLARIWGVKHRVALFIEVLFLVSPLVWGVNFFDFHPVALATPTLLIMLIGLVQRRWKLFGIGLVLSLMIKETVILALGVFGVVMLIAQYWKNKKVDKAYLTILLSSVATYGIAIVVAKAVSGMDTSPMQMYGSSVRYPFLAKPFGQMLLGALSTFFSGSSMSTLVAYFLPLGFLPLFSPLWAAPAIFILLVYMLTPIAWPPLIHQHPATALPFLFAALVNTLVWMEGKGRIQLRLQRIWRFLPLAMITISILVSLTPIGAIEFTQIEGLPGSHAAATDKVIASIPDGATVTAPNHIFTHLCLRTDTYMLYWSDLFIPNRFTGDFGFPAQETEYVVIDWQRKQTSPEGWVEDTIADELNEKYRLVTQIDDVSLYKRL